jgi:site-specific recombinase XerD
MTTLLFTSALAEALGKFLQYKRALNRRYHSEAAALRLFDWYLREHNIKDWESIDSILIEGFLKSRPRTTAGSYNHLAGLIHRFFAWAVVQKLTKRNPVNPAPRRETAKRIPYLFNLQDAKRLLEIARTLPDNSHTRNRAQVYEMIFALLYGLGLRVGEVTRLKLSDVDLARNTLFIRETKFGKSRIVPFGPNLGERLRRYLEKCHSGTREFEVSLFSLTKRGYISAGTISGAFHALVPPLGLQIPPGVARPRLHDLRHSFAVATLLRWYREGIDPNCRLMHLATFLGHTDPSSTAVYLTITEELLREASERFRLRAPRGGDQ